MSDRDERLSRAASDALHAFDENDAPDAAGDRPNEFDETAAQLGLAAAPMQPPASLRDSLMARIALTPQLAPLPAQQNEEAQSASEAAPDAATAAFPTRIAPVLQPVSQPEADPSVRAEEPMTAATPVASPASTAAERKAAARWRKPVAVLVSVAAASALFFGGIAIGQLDGTVAPQTQAEQLAAIAAAPDSQRAVADLAGGGTATLVWSGELGRSALLTDGLAPLDADQTYQLWYIGADGPISAGTFDTSSQGVTWHVLDGEMHAGDTVGVTVEPAGGSKQPTSEPIVAIAS